MVWEYRDCEQRAKSVSNLLKGLQRKRSIRKAILRFNASTLQRSHDTLMLLVEADLTHTQRFHQFR